MTTEPGTQQGPNGEPIYVTRPCMPPLEEFDALLKDIWKSRWLTNQGSHHQALELALAEFLGVKHISLFANGTLALITAFQALKLSGEVITTPYSFVASTHALHWNGLTPVFCDVDPDDLNLDPRKIEEAITPKTTAIMPVHVYGNPCQMEAIQAIADNYGLKVLYDACHAFHVRKDGVSVLNQGDLSILSFHATKVFTTIEGGAIVSQDAKTKRRLDFLKNFGFADEVTVVEAGINGKMNEVQAAFGRVQLRYVEDAIARRRALALLYRERLADLTGLRTLPDMPGVDHNHAYFPVFIEEAAFGTARDAVYEGLKRHGIFSRRYFHPLISQFPTYRGLPTAAPGHLPVAEKAAREVLCLPMYADLPLADAERICGLIRGMAAGASL